MAKSAWFVLCGVLIVLTVVNGSPVANPESSEESEETKEALREMQELCRNNSGSDQAYTNVVEEVTKTMVCFAKFDFETFFEDFDQLSNETRTTFFDNYCPKLRSAVACKNGLITAVRPCLDEDDFGIVEGLVGIIPDAVELLCKNNGEIVFKLEDEDVLECAIKSMDQFMECGNAVMNMAESWELSHLTQEQCGVVTDLRKCFKEKLAVCKAPDLISIYDLFHNALIRMTPCRNYVEQPKVTMIDNNAINEV
ncbi:27 kDa hemolymph glycoprotein-like [Anopheles bellator]|uniref:27 kDa hemolymph glycoprotein-like n=1 Tax=Anopheles bellator TaxID=139047 RepID=UPI00264A0211|nr:27 kDa hemolymph glycoprotein-like [Anopheles bellator]